jgi:hypothetical protein
VAGPKVTSAHIQLRPWERKRYARWWVEQSGLPLQELRDIATAIWSGRELGEPEDPRHDPGHLAARKR